MRGREGEDVAVIEVSELERVYVSGRRKVEALRGVSFSVDSGEFVSIMGPSGSGKSTLMNVIGCLDKPTRGDYCILGKSAKDLSTSELSRLRGGEIGFVFQTFNLISSMDARSNVEVPLVYRGFGNAERRTRAIDALKQVGLADRSDHLPTELSGGEQQRVAVARALVTEPSVVLADEPTGNLDSDTSQSIMRLLQDINENTGVTIIQVTHDENMARYAKRIVRLRDGRIVEDKKLDPEKVK